MIYHCSGKAGFSAIAAAVHLGLLPADRVPCVKELEDARIFDKMAAGCLTLVGEDVEDIKVYKTARGKFGPIVNRTLESALHVLMPESLDSVVPIEVKARGELMTLVAFTAMTFRPTAGLGRKLLRYGLGKGYPEICRNVAELKNKLGGKE